MQTRLPQLDGLRGLAIILVILHNESPKLDFIHLDSPRPAR
jgi:uncharacterized membrane protein